MPSEAPGVANVHVEAVEHGDRLVFLHSVKEGPANQSYAFAGRGARRHPKIGDHPSPALLDGTGTRARCAAAATTRRRSGCPFRTRRPSYATRPAALINRPRLAALRAVKNFNTLSPRDALDLLFRLKKLDEDGPR